MVEWYETLIQSSPLMPFSQSQLLLNNRRSQVYGMGLYEEKMGAVKKSEELTEELNSTTESRYNRFKTEVSNAVYKCTFGKCGTPKEDAGKCQFSEES